jgi:hypothetical protein
MICPHCGARYAGEVECEERFHLALALELENPTTFGAVHHYTVSCYMLQHDGYSAPAWLEVRAMVVRFLREGIPPREMARRRRPLYDQACRTWSVTEGERLPGLGTIHWTRTIADVRFDDVGTYCADVRRWAEAVVADTEEHVRRLGLDRSQRSVEPTHR